MPLLDEIADYLGTVSPSLGVIYKGMLPNSPDAAMAVNEFGGAAPNHGFGFPGLQDEMPGIQLKVRGVRNDYEEPRARIDAAYRALAEVQALTLSGVVYRMIRPQQSPFLLERDTGERCVFVANFLVEKEMQ